MSYFISKAKGRLQQLGQLLLAVAMIMSSTNITSAFADTGDYDDNYETRQLADEPTGPGSGSGSQSELGAHYYHSDSYIYWDVDDREFAQSATDGDRSLSHIKSVTLNGIDVRYYNSNTTTAPEDSTQLIEYYPNATAGASQTDYTTMETVKMDILPEKGWYVTEVLVACTGNLSRQGFTSPYSCGTWSDGGEYDEEFAITRTGELEFELSSLAFAHMSESTYYFILISVEPINSTLYVEYDYGDILSLVDEADLETVEPYFTQRDACSDGSWTVSSSRNDYGNAESIETGEVSQGTQFVYGYEYDPSEAANWVHITNTISEDALKAAESAGYTFAGWRAVYYIDCQATASSGYNNYTYDFSNYIYSNEEDSTLYYSAGEDVILETNVRLIAMWEPVPVDMTPSLAISKEADGDVYSLGDTVTYTLVVEQTNSNVDSVSNVTVSDVLPDALGLSGTPVVSASDGSDAYRDAEVSVDGNGFTVSISELATSPKAIITVTATVLDASETGRQIINEAAASADGCEDVKDDATIIAYLPVLSVAKTPSGDSYNVGETIHYEITLKQITMSATAYDVVLTDADIDENLTVVKGSIEVSGKASSQYQLSRNDDGSFALTIDSLSYGETVTVSFDAIINDDALLIASDPDDVRIVNTVTATFDGDKDPEHPATSTSVNDVLNPHLNIVKTSDNDVYNVNDTITYTIAVTQTVEGAIAQNIVITDADITEGVSLDMATIKVEGVEDDGYSIVPSSQGLFTVYVDSISYGRTVIITVDGTVDDPALAGQTVTNAATAMSETNGEEISDGNTARIGKPGLVVEKSADGTRYNVDDAVIYTISVTRSVEGGRSNDVIISDSIDEGMVIDGSSFIVTVDGKTLSSDEYGLEMSDYGFKLYISEISSEATITYTAIVQDEKLAGTYVDNVAAVTSSNTEDIENPDPVTVEILKPEFVIEKTVDKDLCGYGDSLIYTIKVRQTVESAKGLDVVISDTDFTEGLVIDCDSIAVHASDDVEYEIVSDASGFHIVIDSLDYNDEVVITFEAAVDGSSLADNFIENTASVTSRNNPDVLKDEALTAIVAPALVVTKEADKAKYNVNDEIHYTITVSQTVEGARAENVTLTDTMSEHSDKLTILQDSLLVTIDGVVSSLDVEFTDDGFALTIPEISDQATIEFDALVSDASLAGTSVDNCVVAQSTNTEDIENPDPVTVEILKPEFEILKTARSDADSRKIYYVITVRQTVEDAKAFDVVLNDIHFTEGLAIDYGSISIDAPDYMNARLIIPEAEELDGLGFAVTADVMNYNDVMTIAFTADVPDDIISEDDIYNTAEVSAGNNPEIKSSTATTDLYVPVLSIEKTADRQSASHGDVIEYVIEVRQTTKNAAARNVIVKDTDMTEGMVLDADSIKVDAGDHDYSIAVPAEDGSLFEISIDSLEYGETVTISFAAEVSDNVADGDILNTALAHAYNVQEDVESTAVTALNMPELVVEKAADGMSYNVGDKAHYTIEIHQTKEGATAEDVIITDEATETVDRMADIQESLTVTVDGVLCTSDDYSVEFTETGFILDIPELHSEATVEYDADIFSDSLAGTFVDNVVTVTSSNAESIENPKPVEIEILEPVLSIAKSTDRSACNLNETVEYTIVVEQTRADAKAHNVIIEDTDFPDYLEIDYDTLTAELPDGTVVSLSEEAESSDDIDSGFVLKVDSMEYGDIVTIRFDAKVNDPAIAGRDVVNTATAECANSLMKVESSAIVSVISPSVLMVKSEDRDSAEVGDSIQYTVQISQSEEDALLSGMTLTDNSTSNIALDTSSIIVMMDGEAMDSSLCTISSLDSGFAIAFGDIDGVHDITVSYEGTITSSSYDGGVNKGMNTAELTYTGLTDAIRSSVSVVIAEPEVEPEPVTPDDRTPTPVNDEIIPEPAVAEPEETVHEAVETVTVESVRTGDGSSLLSASLVLISCIGMATLARKRKIESEPDR